MQRAQLPEQAVGGSPGESVTAERDPARLAGLIAEARATTMSSESLGLAGEINALLVAMRTPGNEAAEAKAVLAALDVGSLEGLVDAQGRSCRAEAVETLLACGFPHALQVSPEELELRDLHSAAMREHRLGNVFLACFGGTVAVIGVLAYLGNMTMATFTVVGGGGLLVLISGILVLIARDKHRPGSGR